MTVWISTLHRRASRHRHTTPLLRSSEPTVSVCESASAAYHARVITSKKAPLKMDPSNRGRQSEQTAALGCVSHVPSCACAWGRGGAYLGINHTLTPIQRRGKRQQIRDGACVQVSPSFAYTKINICIQIQCKQAFYHLR